VSAENSILHTLVSDNGARQGQRLEDVRDAITELLNSTLQHSIDGVLGRIASVEGEQHLNSSNNTALSSEVQVCCCWLLLTLNFGYLMPSFADFVSCSCWVKPSNKFKRK
jgi:hypothetical protein